MISLPVQSKNITFNHYTATKKELEEYPNILVMGKKLH